MGALAGGLFPKTDITPESLEEKEKVRAAVEGDNIRPFEHYSWSSATSAEEAKLKDSNV
ncbi:hypothetical protein FQN60_017413 [Etheostoma spectabile]|uniref:Uncharacterized protein n=1 Tax=Etheostoma spectabile TaxID=54343 RepID=A0A5J5D426_9PERO|nr:hypothetical protein FQN60_016725 [Etheostoma spectabile]KAA8592039.1 hypothetical protein FQN60_017413 [Etheostoma spectabile]